MNQSARPGAPSPMPETTAMDAASRRAKRADTAITSLTGAWTAIIMWSSALTEKFALIRPALIPIAAPPILCGLALLFVHGAALRWGVAFFLLVSSFFAMAGSGALASGRAERASDHNGSWSPLRPAAGAASQESHDHSLMLRVDSATPVGIALLVVAALCALPVALSGATSALIVVILGVCVIALYALDSVQQYIAPLDEIIAPLCLGPGLVSLTIVSQGQRMTSQDWLVAWAIGCVTLTVVEARRLCLTGDEPAQRKRSFAALIGPRGTTLVMGAALVASYTLVVIISISPRPQGLPGALLAITALPGALLGLSGLAVSRFTPARQMAASQLLRGYYWFGMALALGMAFTVVTQSLVSAVVRSLGG